MSPSKYLEKQGGTSTDTYFTQLITRIFDSFIEGEEIQHSMLEKMMAAIINHFVENSIESNQSLEEFVRCCKDCISDREFHTGV